MIEMINSLLNKNYAYEKAGHVFDINKFSSYGALSKKTIKDLDAGSRVEISKIKKIQVILFYGNQVKIMNPVGILNLEKEDLVGILNVLRCQKNI